ncbi:MAG: response regulator [Candidatus Zhuqueibacterota bacterium]
MTETYKQILWVDDEIELLKPHIMFLEERGYRITPVTNAEDAISLIQEQSFDLILLDEMLNGMDGLTALTRFKEINPSLPVIMITKNEEEQLMDQAIGGKIDDYLTKPVNPSQILLSCKRILDIKKIESEKLSRDYVQGFSTIAGRLMNPLQATDWVDIYLQLTEWEVQLDGHPDLGLRQTLLDQKRDCNIEFGKFIERNYCRWIESEERPLLSTDVIRRHVLPLLEQHKSVVFIVMDNLRLDQWLTLEPLLYSYYQISKDYYFSILPTATPYSRNAIFSGLFPAELSREHAELWEKGEEDEFSRNRYEHQFLEKQLERRRIQLAQPLKYVKVLDSKEAKNLQKNISMLASTPLLAIVFNFIDFLAHSRSDSEVLKEIAPDESAFRSLTQSWFEHSILLKILQRLSTAGKTVIITSDHGSIRSMRGAKVIGDRETSTNLRYKYGRSLKCDPKYAINIKKPEEYKLPARGINTNYLIAKEDYYFVYPTDFHHYLNYYKDSFQHGGVSMEEMILPVIKLEAK